MRISPGKKFGTILIPVFLEDSENNDENILMSRFREIWRIAKALSRHDEYLLEKNNIPYTHSGITSSKLFMNHQKVKKLTLM